MRLPHLSLGADTLLDIYGLYHLTQLQADPALAELAESFRQAQERLRTRNDEHRRAQAASLVATAVRDRKDMALDEAVLRFNHAVLEYVRKDRRAPLYLKYFSDGLRSVTGASLSNETRRVGALLAKLADETVEELKVHAAPIAAALEELETAIVAQQESLDAEAQAFGVLQSEKIAWLDIYKQDHSKLQLHFHERPRRAETYFRRPPQGRREEEGEEPSVGETEDSPVGDPIEVPIVAERARTRTEP